MRIHTDVLTYSDIYHLFHDQKRLGRIAPFVYLDITEHGSLSKARAFEVRLYADDKTPGDGRRKTNTGMFGAGNDFSATYDEWGWLLAALFARDENMVCGTGRYATYTDKQDFDEKTGFTYNVPVMLDYLSHGEDPAPYVWNKQTVGRCGAGRICEEFATTTQVRLSLYAPRTLSDYREFAFPKGEAA